MKIYILILTFVMGSLCTDEIQFMDNIRNPTSETSSVLDIHSDYEDPDSAFDHIYFENAEKQVMCTDQSYMAKSIHQFSSKLDLAIRNSMSLTYNEDGRIIYPNVVYSPWSVVSILALLLLGASGTTHREIATALQINIRDFPNMKISESAQYELAKVLQVMTNQIHGNMKSSVLSDNISTGCGMFVQENIPMNRRYLRLATQAYPYCEEYNVPFDNYPVEVQRFINTWVSNNTAGKIKDLLSEPLAEYTRFILVNAIYFKGTWSYPFSPEATIIAKFHASEFETINTQMMVLTHELPYTKSDKYQCTLIGLPYKFQHLESKMTMYIIKPYEGTPEGLIKLIDRLSERDALNNLISTTVIKDVIAVIPKLRLDTTTPLLPALRNLGIKALFEPRGANLFSMLNITEVLKKRKYENVEPLFVEDIRHRVTLEVNEYGTEASAATAAIITRDGSHALFRADKPFLFVLRHHKTTIPIFWGSVMRP